MGRLIRKKPTDTRKKKRQDAGIQDQTSNDDPTGVKTESSSGGLVKTATVRRPQQTGMVPAKPKTGTGIKIAFIENSIQFLREVKVELKKVAWPSRKQTIGSTAVVLILVFMIAFFLGIVDIGLASLVKIVL